VATWITSRTTCFWDSCRKDWWLVAWTVMLLSVMSNGTFCTITIVRKKGGDALPGMRKAYFR
jgi:hypothetical protein